MTSLLRLAAEALDRQSNPAYGRTANEDAAQRLAQGWDEEFDLRLRREAAELRHPDDLTSYGWLWLFDWARGREVRLDRQLLFELCEQWQVASLQTVVIDHVVRTMYRAPRRPSRQAPGEDWLDELVRRATAADEPGAGSRHSHHAESLLLALLQVGEEPAIDAARRLLLTPWARREELNDFYSGWLDSLEPAIRDEVTATLRLGPDLEPPSPGLDL